MTDIVEPTCSCGVRYRDRDGRECVVCRLGPDWYVGLPEVGLEMYRETMEDKMAKEARARLNAGDK